MLTTFALALLTGAQIYQFISIRKLYHHLSEENELHSLLLHQQDKHISGNIQEKLKLHSQRLRQIESLLAANGITNLKFNGG